MNRIRLFVLTGILLFGLPSILPAQEKHNVLGVVIGQWQPNSLVGEKPTSVFKGTADSSPFLGLVFDHAFSKTLSTHFSIGYWSHIFYRDTTETVILMPLELGIEHNLVENSSISPYVLYGIEFLVGKEVPGNQLRKFGNGHFNRNSLGFFLLTGVRFTFNNTLALDLNFGYIYAKFSRELGSIKDFTGLRATLGLNVLF